MNILRATLKNLLQLTVISVPKLNLYKLVAHIKLGLIHLIMFNNVQVDC